MTKMEVTNKKIVKDTSYNGSALILAVVLTTLLATVGVLFLLLSRIDKMAASAASGNRQLNHAVDTVVAKISQELVLDVPGVVAGEEYYDYPGPADRWLANLEPCQVAASDYRWPQISDIYNKWSNLQLQADVILDYQNPGELGNGLPADADGDGVADSRWVVIPDVNSSKGRPIYAAIRIIDNGGMINVNTADKFNPNETDPNLINGSSQMQINLMALSWRPGTTTYDSQDETDLLRARANYGVAVNPFDLRAYEENVTWRYGAPNGLYTPFDVSDELELRYRFLVNHKDIDTRLETLGLDQNRSWEFRKAAFRTPVAGGELGEWFISAYDSGSLDPNYAYRHIATIYNMDRIIRPDGSRMLNINTASAQELYNVLQGIIDLNPTIAAQLAVNIVDLRDDDDVNVTVLPKGFGTYYYGFEAQPFISEIAFKISPTAPHIPEYNYFALELYNPFEVPIPLGDFRLEFRPHSGVGLAKTVNLAGYTVAAKSWFVVTNNRNATNDFDVLGLMRSIPPRGKEDPNLVLATYVPTGAEPPNPPYKVADTYDIYLLRKIWLPPTNPDIYLDRELIAGGFEFKDVNDNKQKFYYRRDGGPNNNWHIVYQGDLEWSSSGTLGAANGGERFSYNNYNIPTFRRFVTVGDIARVLTVGPSPNPNDMIGVRLEMQPSENSIRIDLAQTDSVVQQIFNYLTVIDPSSHGLPLEKRIKGRININTAPWFVIAQLPWITDTTLAVDNPNRYKLAQAIVAYRDTTAKGFKSIGELMQAPEMGYYADLKLQPGDLLGFPDLTLGGSTGDGAPDDFEERDVIFARISNLVTVRSDVFTAYILVRIGFNGPQRRVIAILDRSQVSSSTDKVKIIAIQPVPDPR